MAGPGRSLSGPVEAAAHVLCSATWTPTPHHLRDRATWATWRPGRPGDLGERRVSGQPARAGAGRVRTAAEALGPGTDEGVKRAEQQREPAHHGARGGLVVDPRAGPGRGGPGLRGSVSASPFHVALLGEGVGASSPRDARARGGLLGLDYRYNVVDVAGATTTDADLAQLLDGLRREGYRGLNVTHPFKQRVIAHLDRLDDDARAWAPSTSCGSRRTAPPVTTPTGPGFRSSLRSALSGPRRVSSPACCRSEPGARGSHRARAARPRSAHPRRPRRRRRAGPRPRRAVRRAVPPRRRPRRERGRRALGQRRRRGPRHPGGDGPPTPACPSTPTGCARTRGSPRWSTAPCSPSWS